MFSAVQSMGVVVRPVKLQAMRNSSREELRVALGRKQVTRAKDHLHDLMSSEHSDRGEKYQDEGQDRQLLYCSVSCIP